jgi:hypothetical protein
VIGKKIIFFIANLINWKIGSILIPVKKIEKPFIYPDIQNCIKTSQTTLKEASKNGKTDL